MSHDATLLDVPHARPAAKTTQPRRRLLLGGPARGATGGGLAVASELLLEGLRSEARWEVRTIPFGRWAEDEHPHVKVLHQLADLARYPLRLVRARPSIVHLQSSLDRRALLRDVPFALVTRLLGVRLVVMWHGSEPELLSTRRLPWRVLVELLLRSAGGIAVLSSEERAALLRHPRAPQSRVVRNGLDLTRFERRPDLRGRFGLSAGTPLLLFISRLIPTKGLLDVVEAMPAVVARSGAHLIVVGDGPSRAPAEVAARDLGVASFVHFIGAVPEQDTADYYCGCDVLVFPTYHMEGFPMTLFQSVAGGLGVVTTPIRAAADYLREPDHCLFVPPRDPAALAGALARLLSDAELLERMRRNNRDLARRFERRTVAAEFAALYDDLVGAPGEEDR